MSTGFSGNSAPRSSTPAGGSVTTPISPTATTCSLRGRLGSPGVWVRSCFLYSRVRGGSPPVRHAERHKRARVALAWMAAVFVAASAALAAALEFGEGLRDPEYGHRLHALRRLRDQVPGRSTA